MQKGPKEIMVDGRWKMETARMGKAEDLWLLAVGKWLLLHFQVCNCRIGLVLW